MAKTNSKIEFKRVSINIPTDLVERVRLYAEKIGINTTSAYIILLNEALDQKDTMKNMPDVLKTLEELKILQTFQNGGND